MDDSRLKKARQDQKDIIRELEPLTRRSKWTVPKEIYAILIKLNRVYNYLCTEDTERQIAAEKQKRSDAQKKAVA